MKGVKKDNDKPQLNLLFLQFPNAIQEVVKCSMFGHEKYKETDKDYLNMYRLDNAEFRYSGALLRHFNEHTQGNTTDKDSKLLHLAHTAWNALALLEIELNKT